MKNKDIALTDAQRDMVEANMDTVWSSWRQRWCMWFPLI